MDHGRRDPHLDSLLERSVHVPEMSNVLILLLFPYFYTNQSLAVLAFVLTIHMKIHFGNSCSQSLRE